MSTTTMSSMETVCNDQGQARKMTYAAPTLTVYGRMDRLTLAAQPGGTNTDAQYPRCEGENGQKFNCYS